MLLESESHQNIYNKSYKKAIGFPVSGEQDPAVSGNLINPEENNGFVTLRGIVGNPG